MLDRSASYPCPFCDRIQQGDYVLVRPPLDVVHFEPLHPVTPGHRLFVPYQHIEHPSPEAVGDCMEAAARWAERHGEFYNLITSSGSAATQTVPHVHVHFVPRRVGDGLHLPWTGQETDRA